MLKGLWLLLFVASSSFAGVYRCQNSDQEFRFQDKPCPLSEEEVFLPYVYQGTMPDDYTPPKPVKKTRKKRGPTQKQIQKEADKTRRRQEHCAAVKERIQLKNNKLRLGCRRKHCQRLRNELLHDERMKHKYCEVSSR